jgi:hypothetical protein
MCMSEKIAPLFTADGKMLGVSAQKSEDSPIKADRLRVTYAGWDPLRLARMAMQRAHHLADRFAACVSGLSKALPTLLWAHLCNAAGDHAAPPADEGAKDP